MHTATVNLPANAYTIVVGADLFKAACAAEHLSGIVEGRRCLLVTDSNVGPLYEAAATRMLHQAGISSVAPVSIAAGEASKTLASMSSLYEHALDAGLKRSSLVVGLGGGVVGDLAGFLAATYMRGIPCVQMPTSLLAMVDSCVGGKTGVDLPRGKNLVGAFHQPALVLADVSCLDTLPERELACGLAEVVKYAFSMDALFYEQLAAETEALKKRDLALLESVVRRCCELKAEIVVEDEKEAGRRALLNYGHSFGHALETLGGYEAYRHGEAIAIGMGIAADLSVAIGLAAPELPQLQDDLLACLQLPLRWRLPDSDVSAILDVMRSDKKMQGQGLRLVLSRGMGQAVVFDGADERAVGQAIEGRRE